MDSYVLSLVLWVALMLYVLHMDDAPFAYYIFPYNMLSTGLSEEAEDMFRLALACNERILGADHESTIGTVSRIASLLLDQKHVDEAEKMLRRALAGYEKLFGKEHPLALAECHALGALLLDKGESSLHLVSTHEIKSNSQI